MLHAGQQAGRVGVVLAEAAALCRLQGSLTKAVTARLSSWTAVKQEEGSRGPEGQGLEVELGKESGLVLLFGEKCFLRSTDVLHCAPVEWRCRIPHSVYPIAPPTYLCLCRCSLSCSWWGSS